MKTFTVYAVAYASVEISAENQEDLDAQVRSLRLCDFCFDDFGVTDVEGTGDNDD